MGVEENEATLDQDYLDALSQRCQAAFAESEIGEHAASIHLEIENLAESADSAHQAELSQAALELAVFLCSLVESRQPANALARERIANMCEGLRLGTPGRVKPVARAKREPTKPLVVQMLAEPNSRLDLAAQLGRRRIRVDRATRLGDLERMLAREQVLALLLDNYWLDHVQELMQTVENAHPAGTHDPGYIVLLDREDRSRRMYAFRAGVDSVVETASNADIASAVVDYLIERKRSAYKVLLVEDDRAQSLFVRSILAHRGIETAWAKTASEALTLVGDIRPELILLDLHLPDLNGIELAQQLRERPALDLVPIVFLSAEPSMEEQFRAMRLGGDAWISKPVKPRHLLAAVAARAERARRLRARQISSVPGGVRAGMLSRARLVEQLDSPMVSTSKARLLVALAPVDIPSAEHGVDFVAQGKLADEISQFLLAHAIGRAGVCQPSPFLFLLALEHAPEQVEQALEELRASLSSVGWLPGARPVILPFALAAIQVDSTIRTTAESIDAVQSVLQSVRQGKGATSVRFLVGAEADGVPAWQRDLLLSNAQCSKAMALAFAPLLPIKGRLSGQFLVCPWWRHAGHQASAEEMAVQARAMGRGRVLDQVVLGACLTELRSAANASVTLAVPIAIESLQDGQLLAWLRTELSRQDVRAGRIILWVDAEGLRGAPALAQRLLRPAAEMGIKLALGPLNDDSADLDLARLNELSLLVCRCTPEHVVPPESLIKVAADYGKTLVVTEVNDIHALGELFAQQVHYALGDAICTPLATPEFDFPQA